MKNYIGISRDHSGSMSGVAALALKDYNDQLNEIKASAIRFGIDTVLSVMACSTLTNKIGYAASGRYNPLRQSTKSEVTANVLEHDKVSVFDVPKLDSYATKGGATYLWDSVRDLIINLQRAGDANRDDVVFTLLILTDGHDNASINSADYIGSIIRQLTDTGRWTIAFRVPVGMKKSLVASGIPEGNILEINYNNKQEFEQSSVVTQQAIRNDYLRKSTGVRGSSTFYVNTNDVKATDVKRKLVNVTQKVLNFTVAPSQDGMQIRDVVTAKIGSYKLGEAFYQLTKKEKVQDGKDIIVLDTTDGNYYSGANARSLLSLPASGEIKLEPGNIKRYIVFVQSMSVNRKVVANSQILIFKP
jgi:hypothetical protein